MDELVERVRRRAVAEAPATLAVGIGGAVAVGKSTLAAQLASGLAAKGRSVEVVGADGFLHANVTLASRGILERKGFPETYDSDALVGMVAAFKGGAPALDVPVYSHASYDVDGERRRITRPNVLVIEGLHAAGPPLGGDPADRAVDLTVYVDAHEDDVARWFIQRFERLRQAAGEDPGAFLHRWSGIPTAEAERLAWKAWEEINLPNLRMNVAPTRELADVVVEKAGDHSIRTIRFR